MDDRSTKAIIPKGTGQGKLILCFHELRKNHTVSKWAVAPRISCSESSLSRPEGAAETVSQGILRNLDFQLISKAGLKLRVLWHSATFDKAFENHWVKAILKTTLFVSTRKFLKINLNRLTKKWSLTTVCPLLCFHSQLVIVIGRAMPWPLQGRGSWSGFWKRR